MLNPEELPVPHKPGKEPALSGLQCLYFSMPSCIITLARTIGSGAAIKLCGQMIFVRSTIAGTPA